MLFHFLNLSQCVVCMFEHRTIYRVTNLKVHSKGSSFVNKKNPFSRTTTTARLDYNVVSCICDVTKINLNVWGVGRTLGWALHVWLFLYHCISDRNQLFSENVVCHFHFILHIMSDKAGLWAELCLCTALPGKPRVLPLQQRLPLADNELAYISSHNSVSLWDDRGRQVNLASEPKNILPLQYTTNLISIHQLSTQSHLAKAHIVWDLRNG